MNNEPFNHVLATKDKQVLAYMPCHFYRGKCITLWPMHLHQSLHEKGGGAMTHGGKRREKKTFVYISRLLSHLISASAQGFGVWSFYLQSWTFFWGDLSFLEEILLNTFKGREWRNIQPSEPTTRCDIRQAKGSVCCVCDCVLQCVYLHARTE